MVAERRSKTQFSRWNLTEAEREGALLLIKGVSHKEIATVCAVTEWTVREQARSIYSKAGLTGRAMSARTPCLPLIAHCLL